VLRTWIFVKSRPVSVGSAKPSKSFAVNWLENTFLKVQVLHASTEPEVTAESSAFPISRMGVGTDGRLNMSLMWTA